MTYKPKKISLYTRTCKRCGNLFNTYCKFGKVCEKCLHPKGKIVCANYFPK